MKNLKNALLCATFMSSPLTVWAQEISGATTLGYGNTSISNGGNDVMSLTLDTVGSITFLNGVEIGLSGAFSNRDFDHSPTEFHGSDLGLWLSYQFDGGATVGGYFDHIDNDVLAVDITSYGISGGYVVGRYDAELFVGKSETSPSLTSGADWVDYGFRLDYMLTDNANIGGHLSRTEISGSTPNSDLTSLGVFAEWQLGAGFAGFAGLNNIDFDTGGAEAKTLGLGVSYDLRKVSSLPTVISLELARTELTGAGGRSEMDTIRLGITVPFERPNHAAPLNSVSHAIKSPRHTVFSTFPGIFE